MSRGWFQTFFFFSPLSGEDFQFDGIFHFRGVVQPPTTCYFSTSFQVRRAFPEVPEGWAAKTVEGVAGFSKKPRNIKSTSRKSWKKSSSPGSPSNQFVQWMEMIPNPFKM